MSAKKKKRKYTFRKGQLIPYESGSIMHQLAKTERETRKTIASALHPAKKKSKKRKRK